MEDDQFTAERERLEEKHRLEVLNLLRSFEFERKDFESRLKTEVQEKEHHDRSYNTDAFLKELDYVEEKLGNADGDLRQQFERVKEEFLKKIKQLENEVLENGKEESNEEKENVSVVRPQEEANTRRGNDKKTKKKKSGKSLSELEEENKQLQVALEDQRNRVSELQNHIRVLDGKLDDIKNVVRNEITPSFEDKEKIMRILEDSFVEQSEQVTKRKSSETKRDANPRNDVHDLPEERSGSVMSFQIDELNIENDELKSKVLELEQKIRKTVEEYELQRKVFKEKLEGIFKDLENEEEGQDKTDGYVDEAVLKQLKELKLVETPKELLEVYTQIVLNEDFGSKSPDLFEMNLLQEIRSLEGLLDIEIFNGRVFDEETKDEVKEVLREKERELMVAYIMEKFRVELRHRCTMEGVMNELRNEQEKEFKVHQATHEVLKSHLGIPEDDNKSIQQVLLENGDPAFVDGKENVVETLKADKKQLENALKKLQDTFKIEREEWLENLQGLLKDDSQGTDQEKVIQSLNAQKLMMEQVLAMERFYLGRLYCHEMKEELENAVKQQCERFGKYEKERVNQAWKHHAEVGDLYEKILAKEAESLERVKESCPERVDVPGTTEDQLRNEAESLAQLLPLKRYLVELQRKRCREHKIASLILEQAVNALETAVKESDPLLGNGNLLQHQFSWETTEDDYTLDSSRDIDPNQRDEVSMGGKLESSSEVVDSKVALRKALESILQRLLEQQTQTVEQESESSSSDCDFGEGESTNEQLVTVKHKYDQVEHETENDGEDPTQDMTSQHPEGSEIPEESSQAEKDEVKEQRSSPELISVPDNIQHVLNIERFNMSRLFRDEYLDKIRRNRQRVRQLKTHNSRNNGEVLTKFREQVGTLLAKTDLRVSKKGVSEKRSKVAAMPSDDSGIAEFSEADKDEVVKKYKDLLEKARKELSHAQKELQKTTSKGVHDGLGDEVDQMKRNVKEKRSDLNEIEEKRAALDDQRESLFEKVQSIDVPSEATDDKERSSDVCDEETGDVTTQSDAKYDTTKEMHNQGSNLDNTEERDDVEQAGELVTKDEMKENGTEELKKKVDQLQREMDEQKQKFEEKDVMQQDKINELQRKLADGTGGEDIVNDLQKELKKAKEEKRNLEATCCELEKKAVSGTEEKTEHQENEDMEKMEKENTALENENKQKQDKIEELQTKLVEGTKGEEIINDLQNELKELHDENKKLKNAREDLSERSDLGINEEESEAATKREITVLKNEKSELKQNMEKEIDEHKQKFEEEDRINQDKINELQRRLVDGTGGEDVLNDLQEELKKAKEEKQNMEAKCCELEKKTAVLEAEGKTKQEDVYMDKMKKKNAALESENKEKQEKIEELQTKLVEGTDGEEIINDLQNELKELRGELQENKKLKKARDDLLERNDLGTKDDESEAATKKEITVLKNEKNELKQKMEKKIDEQKQKFEEKDRINQDKINELQRKLVDGAGGEDIVNDLQEELKKAKEEKGNLETKCCELETKAASEAEERTKRQEDEAIQTFKKENTVLENENKQKQENIEELQTKLVEGTDGEEMLKGLQDELKELQEENKKLKKEKDDLLERSDLENKDEIAELKDINRVLEATNNEMAKKIEKLRSDVLSGTGSEDIVADLRKEVQDLKEENKELEKDVTLGDREIKKWRKEVDDLKNEKEMGIEDKRKNDEEIGDLQRKLLAGSGGEDLLDELQQQIKLLKEDNENLEKRCKNLGHLVQDDGGKQRVELESDSCKLEEENRYLVQENKTKADEIRDLQKALIDGSGGESVLEQLQDKLEELEKTQKILQKECQDLDTSRKELQEKELDLKKENEEIEQIVTRLRNQNDYLERESDAKTGEILKLQEKLLNGEGGVEILKDLQDQISQLEKENRKLKKNCIELKTTVDELKKQMKEDSCGADDLSSQGSQPENGEGQIRRSLSTSGKPSRVEKAEARKTSVVSDSDGLTTTGAGLEEKMATNSELKHKVNRLQNDLEEKIQEVEAKEQEREQLETELAKMLQGSGHEELLKRLQNKIQDLEEVNRELRKKCPEIKSRDTAQKEGESHSGGLNKSDEDRDKHGQRTMGEDIYDDDPRRDKETMAQGRETKDENLNSVGKDKDERQLRDEDEAEDDNVMNQIKEKENEIGDLTKAIVEGSGEKTVLRDLQGKLDKEKQKCEALEKKCKDLEDSMHGERRSEKAEQEEQKSLKREIEEKDRKINKLQENVLKRTGSEDVLHEMTDEIKELRKENEVLKTKSKEGGNDEKEIRENQISELQDEIEKLRDSIKTKENEISGLQRNILDGTGHEDVLRSLQSEMKQLQDQNEQLVKELEKLKEEDLKIKDETGKTQGGNRDVSRLKKRNAELESASKNDRQLINEHSTAGKRSGEDQDDRTNELEELRNSVKNLGKESNRQKEQFIKLERKASSGSEQEEIPKQLREQLKKLEDGNTELQSRCVKLERKIEELLSEQTLQKNEIDTRKDSEVKSQTTVSVAKVNNTIPEVDDKIIGMDKERGAIGDGISKKDVEEILSTEDKESSGKDVERSRKIKSLRKEMDGLEEVKKKNEDTIKQLRKELFDNADLEKEAQELRDRLKDCEEKMMNSELERSNLKEGITKLREENEKLSKAAKGRHSHPSKKEKESRKDDAERSKVMTEKAGLSSEKAGLSSEKAGLSSEKAGLSSEKAWVSSDKKKYEDSEVDLTEDAEEGCHAVPSYENCLELIPRLSEEQDYWKDKYGTLRDKVGAPFVDIIPEVRKKETELENEREKTLSRLSEVQKGMEERNMPFVKNMSEKERVVEELEVVEEKLGDCDEQLGHIRDLCEQKEGIKEQQAVLRTCLENLGADCVEMNDQGLPDISTKDDVEQGFHDDMRDKVDKLRHEVDVLMGEVQEDWKQQPVDNSMDEKIKLVRKEIQNLEQAIAELQPNLAGRSAKALDVKPSKVGLEEDEKGSNERSSIQVELENIDQEVNDVQSFLEESNAETRREVDVLVALMKEKSKLEDDYTEAERTLGQLSKRDRENLIKERAKQKKVARRLLQLTQEKQVVENELQEIEVLVRGKETELIACLEHSKGEEAGLEKQKGQKQRGGSRETNTDDSSTGISSTDESIEGQLEASNPEEIVALSEKLGALIQTRSSLCVRLESLGKQITTQSQKVEKSLLSVREVPPEDGLSGETSPGERSPGQMSPGRTILGSSFSSVNDLTQSQLSLFDDRGLLDDVSLATGIVRSERVKRKSSRKAPMVKLLKEKSGFEKRLKELEGRILVQNAKIRNALRESKDPSKARAKFVEAMEERKKIEADFADVLNRIEECKAQNDEFEGGKESKEKVERSGKSLSKNDKRRLLSQKESLAKQLEGVQRRIEDYGIEDGLDDFPEMGEVRGVGKAVERLRELLNREAQLKQEFGGEPSGYFDEMKVQSSWSGVVEVLEREKAKKEAKLVDIENDRKDESNNKNSEDTKKRIEGLKKNLETTLRDLEEEKVKMGVMEEDEISCEKEKCLTQEVDALRSEKKRLEKELEQIERFLESQTGKQEDNGTSNQYQEYAELKKEGEELERHLRDLNEKLLARTEWAKSDDDVTNDADSKLSESYGEILRRMEEENLNMADLIRELELTQDTLSREREITGELLDLIKSRVGNELMEALTGGGLVSPSTETILGSGDNQVVAGDGSVTVAEIIAEYKKMNEDATRENQRLNEMMSSLKQKLDEDLFDCIINDEADGVDASKKIELSKILENNQTIFEQISEQESKRNADEERLRSSEDENATVKESLEKIAEENKQMKEELEKTKEERESVLEMSDDLKRENDALEKKKTEVEEHREDNASSKEMIEELQEKLEHVTKELSESKTEKEGLERKIQEVEDSKGTAEEGTGKKHAEKVESDLENELSLLKHEKNGLDETLAAVEEEKNELVLKLERANKQHDEVKEELGKSHDLEDELKAAKQRLSSTESERDDLISKLEEVNAIKDKVEQKMRCEEKIKEENATVKESLEKIAEENKQMKEELEKTKEERESVVEMLDGLKRENDTLEKKKTEMEELMEDNASSKEMIEELQEKLEHVMKELNESKTEKEELERKIQEVEYSKGTAEEGTGILSDGMQQQQQLDELCSKLEHTEKVKSDLKNELALLKDEKNGLDESLAAVEEEKNELVLKLERANKQHDEVKEELGKSHDLEDELKAAKQRLSSIESERDDLISKLEEVNAIKDKVEQNMRCEEEIKEENATVKESLEKIAEENKQMKEELEKTKEERESVVEMLDGLKRENDALEKKKTEMEELREDNASSKEMIEELQEKLEHVMTELNESKTEKEELERKIQEVEDSKGTAEEGTGILSDGMQQQQQLDELCSKLEHTEKVKSDLKNELALLKDEKNALDESLAAVEEEKNELVLKLERANKQHDEVKEELGKSHDLEDELKAAKQRLSSTESERDDLISKLEEVNAIKDKVEQKMRCEEEIKEENEKLKERLKKIDEENQQMKKELENTKEERESVIEMLDGLKRENGALEKKKTEMEELRKNDAPSKETIEELQEQLKHVTESKMEKEELEGEIQKVNELKERLLGEEEIREENEKLKERLAEFEKKDESGSSEEEADSQKGIDDSSVDSSKGTLEDLKRLEELTKENNALREAVDLLEKENNEIVATLEELKKSKENMKDAVESLRQENNELQTLRDQEESSKPKLERLKAERDDVIDYIEKELQGQVTSGIKEALEEYNGPLKEKGEDYAVLNKEMGKLKDVLGGNLAETLLSLAEEIHEPLQDSPDVPRCVEDIVKDKVTLGTILARNDTTECDDSRDFSEIGEPHEDQVANYTGEENSKDCGSENGTGDQKIPKINPAETLETPTPQTVNALQTKLSDAEKTCFQPSRDDKDGDEEMRQLDMELEYKDLLNKVVEHQDDIEEAEQMLRDQKRQYEREKNALLEDFHDEKAAAQKQIDAERKAMEKAMQNLINEIVRLKEERKEIRKNGRVEREKMETLFEKERSESSATSEAAKAELKKEVEKTCSDVFGKEKRIMEQREDELQEEVEKLKNEKKEAAAKLKEMERCLEEKGWMHKQNPSFVAQPQNAEPSERVRNEFEDTLKKEKQKFQGTLTALKDDIDRLQKERSKLLQEVPVKEGDSGEDVPSPDMYQKLASDFREKLQSEKATLEKRIKDLRNEKEELNKQKQEIKGDLRKQRLEINRKHEKEKNDLMEKYRNEMMLLRNKQHEKKENEQNMESSNMAKSLGELQQQLREKDVQLRRYEMFFRELNREASTMQTDHGMAE